MRFKLTSSVLIIAMVWLVVGVGFSVELKELETGVISKYVAKTEKYRSPVLRQAIFSTTRSDIEYDSLVFVGDVLLARNVEFLMRQNGPDYPYQGLPFSSVARNPAVIGNFEASIPEEHQPTPIGQINFSVSGPMAESLAENNFTHLSLANNHSFDFEAAGLINTREVLGKKLEVFGDPNNINSYSSTIVTVDENKIGLLAINGLKAINSGAVKKTLFELSKQTDLQIIYIHWGEEYALRQNSSQRKIAEDLVSYGADVIVGHHPHVVQGIELVDGAPVFYSLGNYIFDQYFSQDVKEGLILTFSFSDQLQISLLPVTSHATLSQPQLMEHAEHAKFLQKLARKSDSALSEMISGGSLTFETEVASSNKVAIIQNQNRYVE